MKQSDTYIMQCRTNYLMNIFPADPKTRNTQQYQSLVTTARQYFDKGMYSDFAGFFMESDYLIPLWTAHLILEFGKPDDTLKDTCLKVIKEYTDNPLAPIVAKQEQSWLENYR